MINERQKSLLDYLSENQCGSWISKAQIVEDLPVLYPRWQEKTSEHHSTAFRQISLDVQQINRDEDIPVVVISSKKGYKVAPNEERANKFIEKELNRALKILKRTHIMTKKVMNDGQIDMLNNIIKAFPNEEKIYMVEDQIWKMLLRV